MMKIWVLLLLVVVTSGKRISRCELAKTLNDAGMSDYGGVSLADWVCLAYAESSYDTDAINYNSRGSKDYGIFQINSYWWCSDGKSFSHNGCTVSCEDLYDISASITCAKQIVSKQGIKAWYGWRAKCKDEDVSEYVAGCDLK